MISPVPGWTWTVRGGGVTLEPPESGAAGAIRYAERLQPLRSVSAILADKATDASFQVESGGAIEPTITHEGEYAAIVTLRGRYRGAPCQRTLGFVFADDWYSEIAGVAWRADAFDRIDETVRKLVVSDRLHLGVRRRRFVYRPPEGWHGYAPLPQYAHWFPPEYPGVPAMVVVYPALPILGSDDLDLGALRIGPSTTGAILERRSGPDPIAAAELRGSAWEFAARNAEGREVIRRIALLRDDRYLYPLFADSPPDQGPTAWAAFDAVLSSIERLPGVTVSRDTDAFDHWVR